MPAFAKISSALAIGLALTGGGVALAQSTTATQGHAAFVEMVHVTGAPGDVQLFTGQVPCEEPAWYVRAWNTWWDKPACEHDGYAYAYPEGHQPPWEGQIRWVNDSTHVDEDGYRWHVAEVVYRVQGTAPEGGELVHAMASEILPDDRASDGRASDYALPIDGELARHQGPLVVGFGPTPPADR